MITSDSIFAGNFPQQNFTTPTANAKPASPLLPQCTLFFYTNIGIFLRLKLNVLVLFFLPILGLQYSCDHSYITEHEISVLLT